MTTLREMIEEAQHQLEMYKHPDVDACQDILNDIVKAAGLGDMKYEAMVDLTISGNELHIETQYYRRGEHDYSTYRLPMSIIDSDDPIWTAKIWGADKEVERAESRLKSLKSELLRAEASVTAACLERHRLDQQWENYKSHRGS